jgi:hypothetical protein
MNRTLFIFIWLVLLASCDKMDISPAQADSFIKFYNTFPVFTGSDVKEIPGKGYVILGTVTSNTEGKQICLIRTDLYGNSVDTARYYGTPLDEEATCIEVLKDHGFAILGQTTDANNKKSVYFLKTDSLGNIEVEKTISGIAPIVDIVPKNMKVDASGSFYIVGYGTSTKGNAPLNKNIWLYALDQQGNPVWDLQRDIGFNPFDDVGNDLQLLSDGRIVITGTTSYPDNKLHAFMVRTAPNGLGASLFPIASAVDEEATCIQTIDENTFVLSGTTQTTTSSSDIMMKKVMYTSTGLQVVWDNKYGNGNDIGVCVILDGSNLHLLATTSSTGINTTITLITTDLEGGNAVYSEIGEGSQLSASSFYKTADNGFIIAGTNKHSENDQSMALIKLKSNGSLW